MVFFLFCFRVFDYFKILEINETKEEADFKLQYQITLQSLNLFMYCSVEIQYFYADESYIKLEDFFSLTLQ